MTWTRRRSSSRERSNPASIMPSMAAWIAASFMRMKSVSVLSRSKTIARITRGPSSAQLLAGAIEPGVDHAVDGRLDRGLLHAHEVGERVVQVEDDRSDHAREASGPWADGTHGRRARRGSAAGKRV